MARVDIEVDIDDVYWDLSKWEKQELADKLYDDGYVPKALKQDLDEVENKWPSGYSEQELSEVLDKIWNNRMFIDSNDLETLKYLAKKGI